MAAAFSVFKGANMKISKGLRISLLMIFIGILVAAASAKDVMMYLKGDTLDFNSSSISDYDKEKMIKGEISSVYGQFAIMTETEKRFGVITSKSETKFYLVGINDTATNKKVFEDYDDNEAYDEKFVVVIAAHSADLQAKLDKNIDGWQDLLNGNTETIPAGVPFEGKLWKQSKDSKYISYRDDFLKEAGFSAEELAKLRIVDTKVTFSELIVAGIGVVTALIGIIILLIGLLSGRRKNDSVDFY